MSNIEHDRIRAPFLNEGLELILDVFGLLPGEPGHWKRPSKSLAGQPVAGLAILQLALQVAARDRRFVVRVTGCGKNKRRNGSLCRHSQADEFHDWLPSF